MIITLKDGTVFTTANKSSIEFIKPLKRWLLTFTRQGAKTQTVLRVKDIASIKGGRQCKKSS